LNLGIKEGNSPYVALCNSDLTYEKDWASNIIKVMEEYPNIKSASPWCPAVHGSNKGHENNVYLGYEVRNEFCGWCIFQQRSLYETIGMLNEGVKFWYSDNILAEELKLRKIDHVLVSNSVVNHHDKNIGKTADTLSNDEKLEFTNGQYQKFIKEYQKLKQKLNINI
jgi:GT2 family glycosyltransferase